MIGIIVIAMCIAFNAFLAGSEAAFIAVNKVIVRELIKRGKNSAKILLKLRENPEKTLSVIQVGITFVGALAAAIGGAGAEEFISPWLMQFFNMGEKTSEYVSIFLVVILITYLSVVIGELVPKTLGMRRPIFFSLKAAPWIQILSQIAYPIVLLLEKSTKSIIRLFPKKHILEEGLIEETGIKLDTISITNQQYVLNIAKIEKTVARDIVIPWANVTFVDFSNTIEEVDKQVILSGHTRLPVVKNNEVVGILNSKEFIAYEKTGQKDWTTIIRPSLSIDVTTQVLAVLRLMQEKRMHMAIVYAEKKRIGIVTMEGIIEEIVGDIYDENDDGAIQRILKIHH